MNCSYVVLSIIPAVWTSRRGADHFGAEFDQVRSGLYIVKYVWIWSLFGMFGAETPPLIDPKLANDAIRTKQYVILIIFSINL